MRTFYRIIEWLKLISSTGNRIFERRGVADVGDGQGSQARHKKENEDIDLNETNQAPPSPGKPVGLRSPKEGASEKRPSGAMPEGRIGEIMEQLPALAEDLHAARTGVEPDFMRIGQDLQVIHRDAKNLTRQVLDLVELLCGKENDGALFRMRGLADDSLAEMETCKKDAAENLARMKSVEEHLGAHCGLYASVEKTGLLLGVIGTNIAIESSRTAESTALFSVMAQTCRETADKMRRICESGSAAAGSARGEIGSRLRAVDEGARELVRLGDSAHGIVREATGEIENLMGGAMRVAEQAGEHSRRLSRQVGDLVVAVQFHDNMSQRLEHVAKALIDVERSLAGGVSGPEGDERDRKLTNAFMVTNLQAEQIRGVVAEIDAVSVKGVRSFEDISGEIGALLDRLSDIRAGSDMNPDQQGQDGDPFDRLRSSFAGLDAVLRKGNALMEPVRHAAVHVSDTVERVSALVRDICAIGFESRLMALNAVVKAAHLGRDGCALEVLAREVNQASVQSAPVLERMNEQLGMIAGAAEELRREAGRKKAALSLDGAVREIAQTYAAFLDDSAEALSRATEIRQAVSMAKARLDFLSALSRRLTASHEQCEAMARDLSLLAGSNLTHATDTAKALHERYTMNREREVHDALFSAPAGLRGETDVHPSPAGGKAAPVESVDDVVPFDDAPAPVESTDDVVLFDDGPASPAGATPSGSPQSKKGESTDDVVLFDDGPGLEAKEGASGDGGEKKEDLGDNVDLF